MYFELIFLMMLAVPCPIIYSYIKQKKEPYKTVAMGTLFACVGIVLVYAIATMRGDNISGFIDQTIDNYVNIIVNNKQALELLGFGDMSKANAIATLTQMYSTMVSLFPAVFIMCSAVISYVEYNILVRISYRKIQGFKPLAYIRNFTLKPNDVMGWFIIYLVGYLLKLAGVGVADTIVLNINVLVETIVALQGLSVMYLWFHSKKITRLVPALATVVLWIVIPMGRTILFTLGLLDLLLNFKARMSK